MQRRCQTGSGSEINLIASIEIAALVPKIVPGQLSGSGNTWKRR
jgi:hypothetical protein